MDTCPYDAGDDYDSDLVCGNYDSCRRDVHDDTESDLVCADIDACPLDALDDADHDGQRGHRLVPPGRRRRHRQRALCADVDS